MSWNGTGTFTRTNGVYSGGTVWADDKAAAIKIVATRHDTHDTDLANGINNCLAKDGQNAMTGALNLGTQDITNAAAGTFSGLLTSGTLSTGAATLGAVTLTADLDAGNFDLSNVTLINGGTPWTSANDGAGSGLDADTVDGTQLADIQLSAVLDGGTTGQYLRKDSGADQDFSWQTLTPSAVADNFQAIKATSNYPLPVAPSSAIPTWTEDINEGTAYTFNASTGVVTINTAGTYMVTFNAAISLVSGAPATNEQVYTYIYKNGAEVLAGRGQAGVSMGGITDRHNLKSAVMVELVATDTIDVRASETSTEVFELDVSFTSFQIVRYK